MPKKYNIYAGTSADEKVPFLCTKEFENEQAATFYARLNAIKKFLKEQKNNPRIASLSEEIKITKSNPKDYLNPKPDSMKKLKEELEKIIQYKVEEIK